MRQTLELQLVDPPPTALGSPAAPVTVQQATLQPHRARRQGRGLAARRRRRRVRLVRRRQDRRSSRLRRRRHRHAPIETLHAHRRHAHQPHGRRCRRRSARRRSGSTSRLARHRRVADHLLPQPDHRRRADAARPDGAERDLLLAVRRQVRHRRPARPAPGSSWSSSVFGNAFTVTDTGAQPTFNSIYVFSFGQPRRLHRRRARASTSFSGNVSKFVGFTELNFPLFDAADDDPVPLATLPPPVPLHGADIGQRARSCSAHVAERGAGTTGTVCDPDAGQPDQRPEHPGRIDQWIKFNTVRPRHRRRPATSFTNFAVAAAGQDARHLRPAAATSARRSTVTGMLRKNSRGRTRTSTPTATTIAVHDGDCSCGQGTCVDGTAARRRRSTSGRSTRARRPTSRVSPINTREIRSFVRGNHAPHFDRHVYVRLAPSPLRPRCAATSSTPASTSRSPTRTCW